MRYWLLRTDRPEVRLDRVAQELTVVSKRRWRVAEDDALILMAPDGIFAEAAKVGAVSRVQAIGEGEATATTIKLHDVRALDERVSAEVLRYSLTIVRNLKQYWRHFQRPYRLLPQDDYETIVRGEAFVARSSYYELLLALPDAVQREFEADELLAERPSSPVGRRNDTFGAKLLRLSRFIEGTILVVGRLLADIARSSDRLQSAAFNVSDHLFVEDGLRRADSLNQQLSRFSAVSEEIQRLRQPGTPKSEPDALTEPSDLEESLRLALEDRDRFPDERRFERVFAP